jgi:hypothetical protein
MEHPQQFFDAKALAVVEASLPGLELWEHLRDDATKEDSIVDVVVIEVEIFAP